MAAFSMFPDRGNPLPSHRVGSQEGRLGQALPIGILCDTRTAAVFIHEKEVILGKITRCKA